MSELVDHGGNVCIRAEAFVPVSYCVCASDGVLADDITHVYSTKLVIGQCRRYGKQPVLDVVSSRSVVFRGLTLRWVFLRLPRSWISRHRHVKVVEVPSLRSAAESASQHTQGPSAVLAPSLVAEVEELVVVEMGVEDADGLANRQASGPGTTRFVAIARKDQIDGPPSSNVGVHKTSAVFSLPGASTAAFGTLLQVLFLFSCFVTHPRLRDVCVLLNVICVLRWLCVWTADKPGALHAAIGSFKQAGVNLTKIESHPSRTTPFSYDFFVDFEGHVSHEGVKAALASLSTVVRRCILLGSYTSDGSASPLGAAPVAPDLSSRAAPPPPPPLRSARAVVGAAAAAAALLD